MLAVIEFVKKILAIIGFFNCVILKHKVYEAYTFNSLLAFLLVFALKPKLIAHIKQKK